MAASASSLATLPTTALYECLDVAENTGSPLKDAGFPMSKPVNVFLATVRA